MFLFLIITHRLELKKVQMIMSQIVQWTARFYRTYKLNPPIPEGQDDATAVAAVKRLLARACWI